MAPDDIAPDDIAPDDIAAEVAVAAGGGAFEAQPASAVEATNAARSVR
jgi:hypothetical protein